MRPAAAIEPWFEPATIPSSLRRIAVHQRGVLRQDQVFAAGFSRAWLRNRLESGRWHRVLPEVVVVSSGRLHDEQRLVAASLYGRERGAISFETALRWHGFRYVPAVDAIGLLVPRSQHLRAAGFVRVHRTIRIPTVVHDRAGAAIADVARAVADTARRLRRFNLVQAIVAEAVQRGLTTPERLAHELAHGGFRSTALFRRALSEITSGARSAPEAEFARLYTRSSVLPPAEWNPLLIGKRGRRLPRPDAYLREIRLAIEVDSLEYHLNPRDWERTMRRDEEFALAGILVVHVTPRRIREQPKTLLRDIERIYRARKLELGC